MLVDQHPAANAAIAFHRERPGRSNDPCPVAITGPDGRFRMTTRSPFDGVPPGDYRITVLWHDLSQPVDDCECPAPAEHDLLGGRYLSPNCTPLTICVRTGPEFVTLHATRGPMRKKPTPRSAGGILDRLQSGIDSRTAE